MRRATLTAVAALFAAMATAAPAPVANQLWVTNKINEVVGTNTAARIAAATNATLAAAKDYTDQHGGGGGVSTNAVDALIASYDATNLTARIAARATRSDATNAAVAVAADKRDKTDLTVHTFAPWTVGGVEFSWDSGMLWQSADMNSLSYSNGVWTMIDSSEMQPIFTATGDEHAMSLSLVGAEYTVTATRSQIYADVTSASDSIAKKSDLKNLSYDEWSADTTYTVGQGVTHTTTSGGTSTTKVYICLATTATVGTFVADEWSDLGTQPLQTVSSKVTALETDKQDGLYTETVTPVLTAASASGPLLTTAANSTTKTAVAAKVLTAVAASASASDENLVTEKAVATAVAAKQDAISDLATIRSGAAAGATAVQSFSAVGGQSPTVTSGVADLSSLFSSANTSLRADNIRMTAADATTIKAYIDAKLGEIETALTRILGGN